MASTGVTPLCYNRAPRLSGRMVYGVDQTTGEKIATWVSNEWFVDRCATHDGVGVGPNNENYPTAHNWNCAGCRWNPENNR